MTINDLTTKQLTAALEFVTSQEQKRFADRRAGLKRLQREMGAHGVKPQEVMAALGLSDPEPIEDDGLVLRKEGDAIVARDAETGQFWADGTNPAEVRENARQQMAAYEEHCRKEADEAADHLSYDEATSPAGWTAQQRAHDEAANAAVMERHAAQPGDPSQPEGAVDLGAEEPQPERKRDKYGFVRRVREPKEVKPKAGKAELVLELLTRPGGATHEEFKRATGWARCQSYPKQVAKRHGLTVTTIREGRTARYIAQRAG